MRPVEAFCPSMCQCDDGSLETSCTGSRLDTVPILLNPALRSLRLSNNRISTLRQSFAFYGELRLLDLSHNTLHTLGSRHFESLQTLHWLNLSCNQISTLETDAFDGLVSLTTLDLSGNRLTTLAAGLFSEMSLLTTLIVSSNKIKAIHAAAFDSLRHLHTLRLDDNNLEHVPSASLASLANLRNLYLGKNLIETIEDLACNRLARLRILYLNDNAVRHIEPMAFHNLAALETLDLSFNQLDAFPVKAFATPFTGQLRHLDFSGNAWRELPASLLQGLASLETLNISYMENLRWIHADALKSSASNSTAAAAAAALTHLVMTNNAMWNRIPDRFLDPLTQLTHLDLSGNAFETMSRPSSLDQWNLQYLNVAYNPLECNCSLNWLWQLLHHDDDDSGHGNNTKTFVVMNVTCSAPAALSGAQLSNLDDQQLFCATPLSTPMIVLLVVVWIMMSLLVIGLLLYWRSRKRIKSSHVYGNSPILTKNGSPNVAPHYYSASGRDEYTYHCAGSIKRIPVTVV